MSIPRDLKVEIPGYGTDKFNAAYSDGGPKLTLQVVKELTGLKINHVVNVDFLGFVRAVDAIGCVYTDVDRRYYHSNEGAPAPPSSTRKSTSSPAIRSSAAKKPSQYVRYRHTDTDIVRSARQQKFLSNARHQVSPDDLITDQSNLIDILTEYTTSDIKDGSELIEVLKLLFEAHGASIEQIHFPAELGPSYVYAIRRRDPRRGEGIPRRSRPTSRRLPGTERRRRARRSKKKGKKAKQGKKKQEEAQEEEADSRSRRPAATDWSRPPKRAKPRRRSSPARSAAASRSSTRPACPPAPTTWNPTPTNAFGPARLPPEGPGQATAIRAYRMVATYQPEYEVTYFGIQGIHGWEDPPILDNPTETRTINGREY